MFNIVCDTHLKKSNPSEQNDNLSDENLVEQKIQKVVEAYRGQPFAWWAGPSCSPDYLGTILSKLGLEKLTNEYAMLCDLANFDDTQPRTILKIEKVSEPNQLEHFIQVLEPYDPTARLFYENVSMSSLGGQEQLFVGYENGVPVEIGILFFHEDTAGIFSLLTREDKRGLGYGTHMMKHLMNVAKQAGLKYATLSASSDSGFRIYERLGFKVLGEFECFEWAGSAS